MIRYFLNVIWQLLITNPIKVITLIVAIICFNFTDTFQNGTYKESVIAESKDGSKWIYVIRSGGDSSGYEVLEYTSKQKVVDGCLVIFDYNEKKFSTFFSIITYNNFIDRL